MHRRTAVMLLTVTVAVTVFVGNAATGSPIPGREPKPLAPDLVFLRPETILGPVTAPAIPFGVDVPLLIDGCFVDERVRKGARRCLRFDAFIGNVGDGPLEVAYGLSDSGTDLVARQRLFHADGTFTDRVATRTEYHPTHAHFHIKGFYVGKLWRSTAGGGRLGKKPVGTGDKQGFCPEDSDDIEERPAERHYSCFTEQERGAGPHMVVGISRGWMDAYTYNLPDQYIEVSTLVDGYYALELEVDPDDVFVEADETNNKVCVPLLLEGTNATMLAPEITC